MLVSLIVGCGLLADGWLCVQAVDYVDYVRNMSQSALTHIALLQQVKLLFKLRLRLVDFGVEIVACWLDKVTRSSGIFSRIELNWNFLFPCFRFRYYSRSRIYYKVQYRGKWGPKNVANPCGFTFIGTHVLVLPCISMEDEQTTVKQNIAKIVQTFKLQIFHRKRNTEKKEH